MENRSHDIRAKLLGGFEVSRDDLDSLTRSGEIIPAMPKGTLVEVINGPDGRRKTFFSLPDGTYGGYWREAVRITFDRGNRR